MSIKTLSWALHESESTGNARLVMIVLADEANTEYGECWLGVETIAERARVSESTARRALRKLEDLGELEVIVGGGNAAAARAGKRLLRPDRVTNCYRLTRFQSDTPHGVSRPVTCDTPPDGHGVSKTAPRGVTAVTPDPLGPVSIDSQRLTQDVSPTHQRRSKSKTSRRKISPEAQTARAGGLAAVRQALDRTTA